MAVTDDAISTIKSMIVSGELKPGQRLPPEKELSTRLGLSRNSLREAVKSLEIIRVLDVRRGDGTYVTSLEPRLLLEAMAFVVDLHQDASVIEIFEVRRVLEPFAAGLAAAAISDTQLAALAANLAQVDDLTPLEQLVTHDLEFHQLIADASGNTYIASLLESMSSATVRARIWRGITQDHATEHTLQEHAAILAALRDHDTERATTAAADHIHGIVAWLGDALRR